MWLCRVPESTCALCHRGSLRAGGLRKAFLCALGKAPCAHIGLNSSFYVSSSQPAPRKRGLECYRYKSATELGTSQSHGERVGSDWVQSELSLWCVLSRGGWLPGPSSVMTGFLSTTCFSHAGSKLCITRAFPQNVCFLKQKSK